MNLFLHTKFKKNKKDLSEIPEEIRDGLEIIPVNTVEEVLQISLERFPTTVIDPEPEGEERSKEDSPEASILPKTESPDAPRTYDA